MKTTIYVDLGFGYQIKMPKQDPEEQIKELKTNLKFISKQLEKAYDKNSKLRVENIELKNKLSILPNSIVKKKDE